VPQWQCFATCFCIALSAGEHMLSGCKLSLLNQIAAPLIAGNARLFVSADLASSGSSGCGSSSQPGHTPQMLPLLSAARHIQAVCTKGPATATGISTACVAAGARWLPCQQFMSQLEQRKQAEQQRRAEAAALAAAEADRRAKLRQAAKQRQEPQRAAAQQPEEQQPQAAGRYQPAAYGSPSKAGLPEAAAAASKPQPTAAGRELPGSSAGPDGSSSLQQLRQQFQALYQQTVGGGGASSPLQRLAGGSNNGSPRRAAGVAAADDAAMHVVALRMQAAAEAQRELLGLAGGSGGGCDFSWSPHSDGGHSRLSSVQPGSGSLGQQLEAALMMMQEQEAAAGSAAGRAAESPLASLADLGEEQGEAYSLGALYRKQPLSRTGAGSTSPQQWHEQEQHEQWQVPACSAAEGTPQSSLGAAGRWPAEPAAVAPASAEPSQELSDVFKSENMPLWSHAGATAAGASTASCIRTQSAVSSQQQQHSGGGLYAAMQRRRPPPLSSAAVAGVGAAGGSPPGSQQLELFSPSASALVPGAASGQSPAPHLWQHAAAELDSADVAGLLEDLQREQRLNAALLQQLHEVQQQLEEAAAAVAAAQPPAPGVEDPADFNGLLAGVWEAMCATRVCHLCAAGTCA
jgi:hypothetical protein